MKQSGCPKCGGTDVRTSDLKGQHSTIPVTRFRGAYLTHRVCVSCGYVEAYVTDPKYLKLIAEKWKPVG
jgi:predicted nucleic-acid-binding Zn-ribbon protein